MKPYFIDTGNSLLVSRPDWGMMADALRIEHLSKTFAGQIALDDVSIDVAAGEVHTLVGQNGSGKSTLIKILAGYHQPDPGDGEAG